MLYVICATRIRFVRRTLTGNWTVELFLDILEPGSCVYFFILRGYRNNKNIESLRTLSPPRPYQKSPSANYPPF